MRDYYRRRKRIDRAFSYRSFAAECGLAPSLFRDILSRRQNLTPRVAGRYAQAMRLNDKEREYLSLLVRFCNGKNNEEKYRDLLALIKLRPRYAGKVLSTRQYEFFSTWYHPVLREMIDGLPVAFDAGALAARIRPALTPGKVRESVRLLESLDLIRRTPEGTWKQTDSIISSAYEAQNLWLRAYHTEMLRLARESIDRTPSHFRELQGMTLRAGPTVYRDIKTRIRSFTDEILELIARQREHDDSDVVFQLGVQLFPFTHHDGTDDAGKRK